MDPPPTFLPLFKGTDLPLPFPGSSLPPRSDPVSPQGRYPPAFRVAFQVGLRSVFSRVLSWIEGDFFSPPILAVDFSVVAPCLWELPPKFLVEDFPIFGSSSLFGLVPLFYGSTLQATVIFEGVCSFRLLATMVLFFFCPPLRVLAFPGRVFPPPLTPLPLRRSVPGSESRKFFLCVS